MGVFVLLLVLLLHTAGTLEQRAQPTDAATQEVASNLRVANVYGVRPDADAATGIGEIKIMLQLSAGALPLDLGRLVVRYADGDAVTHYAKDAQGDGFALTWLRGEGHAAVMAPGDLVELALAPPSPLPPRAAVAVSLIPETGSAVRADFKTPPTYGDERFIMLR